MLPSDPTVMKGDPKYCNNVRKYASCISETCHPPKKCGGDHHVAHGRQKKSAHNLRRDKTCSGIVSLFKSLQELKTYPSMIITPLLDWTSFLMKAIDNTIILI